MSSQIKGIAFMAMSSAIIPVADGIAKVLSENHSALLVSSGRYFAASFLLLPIALLKHKGSALPPRHRLKPHIMRTLLMVVAMTLFYVSIVTIDLATAVSAFFVGPVVGSVAAVFMLGEKMTRAKLVALVLGFAGAIIIAKPGTTMSPACFSRSHPASATASIWSPPGLPPAKPRPCRRSSSRTCSARCCFCRKRS